MKKWAYTLLFAEILNFRAGPLTGALSATNRIVWSNCQLEGLSRSFFYGL